MFLENLRFLTFIDVDISDPHLAIHHAVENRIFVVTSCGQVEEICVKFSIHSLGLLEIDLV